MYLIIEILTLIINRDEIELINLQNTIKNRLFDINAIMNTLLGKYISANIL